MKNQKRKGFTLVELLIVIAILAILATVSVVGYTSFIKRARQSVDEQFATQLNTILEAAEVPDGKPANIAEVQKLLEENQIGSFVATNALNTFYWVGSENRVIIFTKDSADATTGKVTFPVDLAKSLSGQTTVSAAWYDLATGAKFVELSGADASAIKTNLFAAIASTDYNGNDVIRLPANAAIELRDADFVHVDSGKKDNKGNTIYYRQLSEQSKNIKIDLNGGTITHSDKVTFSIGSGQTVELSNGTYKANSHESARSVIAPQTSASVVLRNMTIETTGSAVFPAATSSEVVLDNCRIKAAGYGVATNRSESRSVRVEIKNSTIEAQTAVFLNTSGNMIIDNSTLIGNYLGLVVRLGSATVSNCTIKTLAEDHRINGFDVVASGTPVDPADGSPFTTGYWGSGDTIPSAALVVGDYYNGTAYDGMKSVTLNNVTLTSAEPTIVPTVILSSTPNSKVVLNYDNSSNVGEIKVYSPTNGSGYTERETITVNGVELEK